MNLCSDGHEEVCYEGRKCPVCVVVEQTKILGDKVEELEGIIAEKEQL